MSLANVLENVDIVYFISIFCVTSYYTADKLESGGGNILSQGKVRKNQNLKIMFSKSYCVQYWLCEMVFPVIFFRLIYIDPCMVKWINQGLVFCTLRVYEYCLSSFCFFIMSLNIFIVISNILVVLLLYTHTPLSCFTWYLKYHISILLATHYLCIKTAYL